ncbi:MAG TPA: ABATE domain-containing protein [Tepidisphaeraceae bacterium]|nr:ABATE domain-containing protein [Tepidisphaeraceae bacterium]
MARPKAEQSEWIDGFLFVGNHLALNFLNTRPVLHDGPHELLPDANAFQRWLVAAGLVPSAETKSASQARRRTPDAAPFMQELRDFRERVRAAVLKIESGALPTPSFLSEVNRLLATYPRQSKLVRQGSSLIRKFPFDPNEPQAFWALIAEAVASLLTESDPSRMRQCQACVVHFLDTSKKGSRRWCSMNICGNKVKVARYRRLKRRFKA